MHVIYGLLQAVTSTVVHISYIYIYSKNKVENILHIIMKSTKPISLLLYTCINQCNLCWIIVSYTQGRSSLGMRLGSPM